MESLGQKASRGIIWSAIDQFAAQGIGFVIGIILARLLTPADYGVIGMLAIFLAIAQTVIDSGFSAALVQRKDRTEIDFSTVFYCNFALGIAFYLLLFFSSPWIAAFYEVPLLEPVAKIVALHFVVNAFSLVHRAKLQIQLDFKTQTKVSIVSVVLSGTVGIAMAYAGFGVWSLVAQTLAAATCQTIMLYAILRWRPALAFSMDSFRRLFGFGSKMLASSLLNTAYANIYTLVIGKGFSTSDLGYYTRAKQLEELPAANITSILQRVTFPVLCSIQDDSARLMVAYRRLIRLSSFIIFPLMFLLVAVARPLVLLLLTEKWLPAVDLFQILCFAGMWYPIHAMNLSLLQAKGRSDLFLRLEIWKKVLITVALVVTIPLGLRALMLGQAFTSFASLFLNTYYTGKYFHYGIGKQMKDIFIFPVLALALCGITLLVIGQFDSSVVQVVVGTLLYASSYLAISKLIRLHELDEILSIVLKPLRKVSFETPS